MTTTCYLRGQTVYVRLRDGDLQLTFSTRIRIDPKTWDGKRARVKPQAARAAEMNQAIDAFRKEIHQAAESILWAGEGLTRERVAERVERLRSPGEKPLAEWFEVFLAEKALSVSAGSVEQYSYLRARIRHLGGTPSSVREGYLRDMKKLLEKDGLQTRTVRNYLTNARSFLAWLNDRVALPKGWDKKQAVARVIDAPGVFLTDDELRRIAEADIAAMPGRNVNTRLRVRDWFLFQCYTGLRVSDVKRLQLANITKDDAGRHWIRMLTQKTGEAIMVPLSRHALEIWQRQGRPILPRTYHQNTIVQGIAKAVGIDEPTVRIRQYGTRREEEVVPKWQLIGTHTARRTFIVRALRAGVRLEVVQKLVGHASVTQTLKYVRLIEDDLAAGMDKLDGIG